MNAMDAGGRRRVAPAVMALGTGLAGLAAGIAPARAAQDARTSLHQEVTIAAPPLDTDIRNIPYYAGRTLLRMWIAFGCSTGDQGSSRGGNRVPLRHYGTCSGLPPFRVHFCPFWNVVTCPSLRWAMASGGMLAPDDGC